MLSFKKVARRFSFSAAVLMCVLVLLPNTANARDIFLPGPSENQCRVCHEDLKTFPQLEKLNPGRHHQLIGQPITGLAKGSHDTVAPGDTSTGEYQCMSCHGVHNPETQQFELVFTKDCLACHPAASVTTSPGSEQNVHHFTETYDRECHACHKSPLYYTNKKLADTYDKLSDSEKANWSYNYKDSSSSNADLPDPNKAFPTPDRELSDYYKDLAEYYKHLPEPDYALSDYYQELSDYYKY